MAEELTAEQLIHYKQCFNLFDKDGDGVITAIELGTVLSSLGQDLSEDALDKIIQEYDCDEDGCLSFIEFIKFMEKRQQVQNDEDELLQAFQVFDLNKDGVITVDELKEVLGKVGEIMTTEEIEDMVKMADKDGDGVINYEEFVKMLLQGNENP